MNAAIATPLASQKRNRRYSTEIASRGRRSQSAVTELETLSVDSTMVITQVENEPAFFPEPVQTEMEVMLDGALVAAFGEMLKSQRMEEASSISEQLVARGVDATVCAFLEDDLREAADALADAEAYFQETLEALGSQKTSTGILLERASDATVLERVDHLHQVLFNMRRRLVQVGAGLRRSKGSTK